MVDEGRFRNETTLRLFYGDRVRRYPPSLLERTQNKLKIVYAASRLEDLMVPPRQQAGGVEGRQKRAVEHPHQRPVAHLLQMGRHEDIGD